MVRSKRASPAKPPAVAQTRAGMKISASAESTSSTKARPFIASLPNLSGFSSPSYFLEKIGTNAALKAPSAKKRRNMLGRRKAATKASITGPGPM